MASANRTSASTTCPACSGPRLLVPLGPGRWCCWATGAAGHKRAPGVLDRARRLVAGCGFAAAAIDMPGFGDRPMTAEDERFMAEIRARRAAGEAVIGEILRDNVAL